MMQRRLAFLVLLAHGHIFLQKKLQNGQRNVFIQEQIMERAFAETRKLVSELGVEIEAFIEKKLE